MADYQFIPHTADIKIKIRAASLNAVFSCAAKAFADYISNKQKIDKKIIKKIKVEGQDNSSLLYQFLDELIYLIDAKDFVCSIAKVKIKEGNLEAVLAGDKASKYELDHVKAATYGDMKIEKKKTIWEAEFVLDV